LAKDFTTQSEGAPANTSPTSHKASLNQDKGTYTSGEQEQLIELSILAYAQQCKHHKLSTMVWQNGSHLITTHPSTMRSIIKQIQASITCEAK
jgi:hypothetical protein